MHLLAVQTRGGRIEARHHGDAVVVGGDGAVVQAWGDPEAATYWRSAAKPLQAAAIVATGAWEASGLDDEALAVACGSHAGEGPHRAAVLRTLEAIGRGPAALRCGVHRPWSRHSVRPPDGPDALGNNCSGKHAAMLAACVHEDWDLAYLDAAHPVQRAVARRIARCAGPLPTAVDGCGVPTFWGTLPALARCFRSLRDDPPGQQVLKAIAKHPLMLAGTGQFCTDLARHTKGRVLGKYGALGVYVALDTRSGEALAVKTEAGDAAAAKATAGRIMVLRGWLEPGEQAALDPYLVVPNRNHAGVHVGTLQSVL